MSTIGVIVLSFFAGLAIIRLLGRSILAISESRKKNKENSNEHHD